MKIISEFDWIKNKGSCHSNVCTIIKVPSKKQLRRFICEYMVYVDRCLVIHTDYYLDGEPLSDLQQQECKLVSKTFTEVFHEFYPWQFNVTTQQDNSSEFHWTEVNEWLDKYVKGAT